MEKIRIISCVALYTVQTVAAASCEAVVAGTGNTLCRLPKKQGGLWSPSGESQDCNDAANCNVRQWQTVLLKTVQVCGWMHCGCYWLKAYAWNRSCEEQRNTLCVA